MKRIQARVVITCCLLPLGAALSQAAYTVVDGGIPAGIYTVKIRHETLGESEQTVAIEPSQTTEFNVGLSQ